jgi:hypothetical protein
VTAKEEPKKTNLFKGSSTNPFAKRTADKKEELKVEPPKDTKNNTKKSEEIVDEYSMGSNTFIEDTYENDFF